MSKSTRRSRYAIGGISPKSGAASHFANMATYTVHNLGTSRGQRAAKAQLRRDTSRKLREAGRARDRMAADYSKRQMPAVDPRKLVRVESI